MQGVRRVERSIAGLIIVTAALVGALGLAGYLQYRQSQLLNGAVKYEKDYLVWNLFQLNVEYLQLRELVRTAVHAPRAVDDEEIRLRYETFVSRIELLRHERNTDERLYLESRAEVLPRLEHFVDHVDSLLKDTEGFPLEHSAPMLAELEDLAEPLRGLSMTGSHVIGTQVDRRNSAVQQSNLMGAMLLVVAGAMMLTLGALLLRQFRSIESRRRLSEEMARTLAVARQAAEEASAAKSAFVATMSHELRTPFQGILGMLHLLRTTELSDTQRDYVATAEGSTEHLLALLDDVLDVAKLESGRLQLELQPFELRRLLDEVARPMAARAQEKGLSFRLEVDDAAPAWVQGDHLRIKQILFNLLGNAIKFSDSGGVTVTVEPAAAGGAALLAITVKDSGIGMDAAMLQRLFQPFSQADASISRRYGGTGLGLAISQELASLMGGSLGVRSKPGEGSSFTLTLPLPACETPVSAPAPDEVASPPQMMQAGAARPPAAHAQGAISSMPRRDALQVLVCEDNPVNRKFMEIVLRRLGHEARFCTSGLQALHELSSGERHYDVVLMDLHTPEMDGITATAEIRKLPPPASQVKIFAVTADVMSSARQRAQAAGVDGFIAKPVGLPALTAALAEVRPQEAVPA